jgi:hypothetical protein
VLADADVATLTRSLADAKRISPLRIGPIAESVCEHGGHLASSRAPAVARVLFVTLLTVASYVIAFGGVGSAALDSAVAHFVLPAGAAPLLLGTALRSGVIAWPAGVAAASAHRPR